MKRLFFVLVVFFAMQSTFAQEKGLHLTLGGDLGWTNFAYNLDGGSYQKRVGQGGYFGMQYFFNCHWGISLTGEYFVFNTQSRYADKSFLFYQQTDNEGHRYDLTIRLKNWKENQTTHFVEIPLMGMFQQKFGKKERHGLYVGLGVKAQIPLSYSFERAEGDVKVSAYYPEWNLHLGQEGWSVEMPQHGYGTNKDRLWNGSHNLKTGFAVVGEFGFLFGLSPRVDLTLGVSADYGFTNISSRKDDLVAPVSGKTQQDGSFVAEQVYYNGILNSSQTSEINAMSLRGKLGLRIKIGKLKQPIDGKDDEMEEDRDERPSRIPIIDTIFVYPVIIQVPVPEPYQQYTGSRVGEYKPENARKERKIIDTIAFLPEEIVEELIESIYFDLGKSNLTPESKEILNRKAVLMKNYPKAILSVVGHTCDIGSGNLNDKLSYDRAEEARIYLIKKGIAASRIITVPQGMKNPTYPNTSELNRELNRRVDFFITR